MLGRWQRFWPEWPPSDWIQMYKGRCLTLQHGVMNVDSINDLLQDLKRWAPRIIGADIDGDMDARYGQRSGRYGFRGRKLRNYDNLNFPTTNLTITHNFLPTRT